MLRLYFEFLILEFKKKKRRCTMTLYDFYGKKVVIVVKDNIVVGVLGKYKEGIGMDLLEFEAFICKK